MALLEWTEAVHLRKVREVRALVVEITDENGDIERFLRLNPWTWFIECDGSWDPMSATEHLERALEGAKTLSGVAAHGDAK